MATIFSSLNDIEPYLKRAYKKYCIDGTQCKCATCPVGSLLVNLHRHVEAKNEFLIFGDVLVIERLGKT